MITEKPSFEKYESRIVASKGKNKTLLEAARGIAEEYKHLLDYIMTKFIEEFGHKLDVNSKKNSIYINFVRLKSNEYSEVTRFIRLIDFYEHSTA
jgi:rRNA processing protein Krr1/Pno1